MKKLLLLFAFISITINAQNKYLTKTGTVNFEASVPSFEAVSAKNNAVTAILNTENGEFASLVLVKGFRFENALMEEHFNENYAESDAFPKATFKGKLIDFSIDKLDSITSTFSMEGTLSFHGKTVSIDGIAIDINLENNGIRFKGMISAKASDFDIEIPKIVSNKIAEDITIHFEFFLIKK